MSVPILQQFTSTIPLFLFSRFAFFSPLVLQVASWPVFRNHIHSVFSFYVTQYRIQMKTKILIIAMGFFTRPNIHGAKTSMTT